LVFVEAFSVADLMDAMQQARQSWANQGSTDTRVGAAYAIFSRYFQIMAIPHRTITNARACLTVRR
jgi:hypothetical protein